MSEQEAPPTRPAPLSPVRQDNLTERVFEHIRSAITSKMLAPGAQLVEAKLAEELNVSKTPVREALLRLREIGLIEPDGRRGGGRVVERSHASIATMYEVREALEVQAAFLAAERGTRSATNIIEEAAARSLASAQADDRAAYREADLALHLAVADAAGNARLVELVRNSFDLIATVRLRDFEHVEVSRACGAAHVSIATAIREGNAVGAGEAMRVHVRFVRDRMLEDLAERRLS